VLAILLTATILGVGLAPYGFAEIPRQFDWIPFRAFVDSSILAASGAFLTKSFLFGAAVWAAARSGLGLVIGGGSVTLLLLAVGWAQTYLPGRSGGITDAAIALCMILAMYFLRPSPRGPMHRSIAVSQGETVAATLPAGTSGS
jgi:hypothetical protein